jgi:F-type H+-transporting ATPase subunit b
MELFKIDPGLMLWTWITFGVLLLLMGKYVYPPLLANLKSREKKIRDSVRNADQIEQRLADSEREHEEMLKRSMAEADEILRRTRAEAAKVRQRLVAEAEQEVEQMYAQARARIAEERQAVVESIRQELADVVCEASEKVIGKSFTSAADRDWAKELVDTL